MKKQFKKISQFTLIGLLLGSAISCKKEQHSSIKEIEAPVTNSITVKLQTSFAKVLAKAMKSDESLRNFIKQESLKQFDKDHDVLYQLVKDKEVGNGETLRQKLLNFTTALELEEIETNLPLLTIFVPTLPNFTPEIWNTAIESPMVAVVNDNVTNIIKLYDDLGKNIALNPKEIPGFPVLVIKQNERVITSQKINKLAVTKGSGSLAAIKSTNGVSFAFIDEAFDGSIPDKTTTPSISLKQNKLATVKGSVSRIAPSPSAGLPNPVDQVNIDAYNSGSEWHRDYVYYGITPSNPNGKFRNNYSEFITSFKFLNGSDLYSIAEQDSDPKPTGDLIAKINPTSWTEGKFEIRITILINAKNGISNELTKTMNVAPRDIFQLDYKRLAAGLIYKLIGVTPIEYHPNIELVPWDLESYGTGWKFIFYEIDNAQEVINSYENTTTYATNFGLEPSFNAIAKLGLKFGVTATTSEKRTFSVKTTLTSDFLGEATLTFDQPIIIGKTGNDYITREITTGNNISISVEPRKVF